MVGADQPLPRCGADDAWCNYSAWAFVAHTEESAGQTSVSAARTQACEQFGTEYAACEKDVGAACEKDAGAACEKDAGTA